MKIKYIVKENEGLVIGEMINKPNILHEMESYGLDDFFRIAIKRPNVINDVKIKAIARVSGDDIFDAETGKKLVEAKINMKRHARLARQYWSILQYLKKAITKFEMLYEMHAEKVNRICEDIDRHWRGKLDE